MFLQNPWLGKDNGKKNNFSLVLSIYDEHGFYDFLHFLQVATQGFLSKMVKMTFSCLRIGNLLSLFQNFAGIFWRIEKF